MENHKSELDALKKYVILLNQIIALVFQNIDDREITTDLLNLIEEYATKNKKFFNDKELELINNSFQELSIEEVSKGYTLEECENCGWWGSSYLTSSDIETKDLICPFCGRHTLETTGISKYLSNDKETIDILKELINECGYWETGGTWKHLNPKPETVIKARQIIEKQK